MHIKNTQQNRIEVNKSLQRIQTNIASYYIIQIKFLLVTVFHQCNVNYMCLYINRGCTTNLSFFEVGKKIQKKGEIIYHSIEKRFPKFGNLFLVWKIFLYYYIQLVITMVIQL